MNVETESTKLMTFVKSLELHREGHLRALIVNYADERVKQHNKDLVEKITKMPNWYLDYVPTPWQDKDEDPKFIVLQDLLKIIKEEK